ncbi:MAG TPA: chemotaxis protein CheD [Gemmatimonadaceae bacterium]|nr:chemotaxis protein CheD [Gemmatimonadaceae bacterium]
MTAPRLRASDGDVVVGIGEMAVGRLADEVLVTYALGSCLGVAVYDAVARVGGLLHAMLPTSTLDPDKAARNPHLFVDTGVPALFRACYAAGAAKQRMIVRVAGGARLSGRADEDQFQIGKRNILTLRKLLWKNGVMVQSEDVGGEAISRTIALHIGTGELRMRRNGADTCL